MTNAEFIPTLTHATERDIDLLLVEEIHASRSFATRLANRVGIPSGFASWDVKHSKRRTRSRREIDIFVEFDYHGTGQSALLIENKLDAAEQPDQAESYREELAILSQGDVRAAMLLVCPQSYAAAQREFAGKFDAVVTYEEIAEFLRITTPDMDPELAHRMSFRAELIDQAIYKHRRGYQSVPNAMIGDFNARYVALLSELAPEIKPGKTMLKPANPNGSSSMIYDQDASLSELDPAIRPRRFSHELSQGHRRSHYAAATFAGWGVAIDKLKSRIEHEAADLGDITVSAPPATKLRPNPGLIMKITTAPVDNQGGFDEQIGKLTDGIMVASRLRNWLVFHQDVLAQWRSVVDDSKVSS